MKTPAIVIGIVAILVVSSSATLAASNKEYASSSSAALLENAFDNANRTIILYSVTYIHRLLERYLTMYRLNRFVL